MSKARRTGEAVLGWAWGSGAAMLQCSMELFVSCKDHAMLQCSKL
jgi:hypothetical protein